MAGDWIKMRVWLARDPRVIQMADYLAEQRDFMNWLTDPVQQSCKESAYEHVTRNVTAALCVTGLLVTWGAARERGDRDGDDLVIESCDLDTISAVADIPCFGDAMASVRWLRETPDGCIVFPKYFKENETPEEKHRRQNAERQARYREKQAEQSNVASNVTNNVTVTTEKRREEKKKNPLPPWVPVDAWDGYVEMRTKMRKPLTNRAKAIALAKLESLKDKGFSPEAVLNEAVEKSWLGIYEPKSPPPRHQFEGVK